MIEKNQLIELIYDDELVRLAEELNEKGAVYELSHVESYRLQVVEVTLRPLRDRQDDILPLVHHFMSEADSLSHTEARSPLLDDALRDYLVRRPYPGNVRQLKHLVARLLHRHVGGGVLTVGSIPIEDRPDEAFCEAGWQIVSFEQASATRSRWAPA